MKKRGISTVIATVLILALTISLIGIVYVISRNLVQENLDKAGSCSQIFDSVSINRYYTCFNSTNSSTRVGISLSEINVTEVIINIGLEGREISKKISYEEKEISGIKELGGSDNNSTLPGQNEAKTYIFTEANKVPDYIKIIPVVNKKQCEISDQLFGIQDCMARSR